MHPTRMSAQAGRIVSTHPAQVTIDLRRAEPWEADRLPRVRATLRRYHSAHARKHAWPKPAENTVRECPERRTADPRDCIWLLPTRQEVHGRNLGRSYSAMSRTGSCSLGPVRAGHQARTAMEIEKTNAEETPQCRHGAGIQERGASNVQADDRGTTNLAEILGNCSTNMRSQISRAISRGATERRRLLRAAECSSQQLAMVVRVRWQDLTNPFGQRIDPTACWNG